MRNLKAEREFWEMERIRHRASIKYILDPATPSGNSSRVFLYEKYKQYEREATRNIIRLVILESQEVACDV